MPYYSVAKNSMLDAISTTYRFMSLHEATPSTDGSNEVSGGSYTRIAVTWNTAASGEAALSSNVAFSVPAGSTVTHVGVFATSTGTTLGAYADVTDEGFAGAGTYTVTASGTKLDIND